MKCFHGSISSKLMFPQRADNNLTTDYYTTVGFNFFLASWFSHFSTLTRELQEHTKAASKF